MVRYIILSAVMTLSIGGCAPNTPPAVSASPEISTARESPQAAACRAAGTVEPWIGTWHARSGDAVVTMNITSRTVRGQLISSVTTFAFTGGIDRMGHIDITLAGKDHWDNAEISGNFPVVELRSGSDGRSFETMDGRMFRLCA